MVVVSVGWIVYPDCTGTYYDTSSQTSSNHWTTAFHVVVANWINMIMLMMMIIISLPTNNKSLVQLPPSSSTSTTTATTPLFLHAPPSITNHERTA